jgi:hypothetical protein
MSNIASSPAPWLITEVAHHVDPGIDRRGRYRRITGPPYDIRISGSQVTHDA